MIVNGEERFNYNHYNMTYNSILILRNAVKMPNAFFYIGYWYYIYIYILYIGIKRLGSQKVEG